MRLAVIGLGLIGGSAARAMRQAGVVDSIVAWDPDPQQGRDGVALGVIDQSAGSTAEAVRDADVVLLAVPVLHTGEALAEILPALRKGAILTDVGSTKMSVLRDVRRVCGSLPPWFVPAHPIAGTEKSGVRNSLADLFRNHRVILTPHAEQDPQATRLVRELWTACGARVVEMAPDRHDAIFAATSHLPHVLAYSFVDMLAELDADGDGQIFPNAGGGFRDFTRIASSSSRMWHDIVRANADSVSTLLERQIGELQQILEMIRGERWDDMQTLFERARQARERYLGQIE